jgi:cell division septum initiation protein DivIVA
MSVVVMKTKYSDEYIDRVIRNYERMSQEIKSLKIENTILKYRLDRAEEDNFLLRSHDYS